MSNQVDGSNPPQAGESHVVRFAARKKKWGPRARTGCATCRARHVKCDEARPVCGRCVTAGRVCSGINYGTTSVHHRPAWSVASGPGPSPGFGSGSGVVMAMAERSAHGRESVVKMVERHSGSVQILRGRGNMVLTRDLLPQGWHFSEACQYFNEVMLTRRIAKQIVPSDFHHPVGNTRQKFSPPPDHQHTVIMVALAHRISFIFHAEERGTTQLCQHRATAHLRTSFYRHLGEAIRALNHHLVDINLPGVVWGLRKIANIVSAELYMVSTSWRHHVEGFLALVKHGGGIGKILNHFPPIRLAVYYMIIIANVANTTSPSHDLGMGSIYPGKEATRHLYSTTLYPSFPCATSLFMDMMRITELRDPRHGSSRDVRRSIVEVFRSIDEFVPNAWAEAYEIPKTADINIIARMFKASVALYGVLALGKFQESWIDAAHYFPSLTNAGKLSHGPLRRALSGHLLGVLEEAARALSNQESLSWPLTVLGVGIADGSAEDKEFVKKALLDVGMDPNADAGPMDSRGRLLEFWDAGGTQWDECFNRPTLVLA